MPTLQELRRALEEWDIRQRIIEKINIWGVRHNPSKIAAIPIDFISAAIIYYLVRCMRANIQNYSQIMQMTLSYRLKLIYNSLALSQFKSTSFFEFCIVVLAKLTHYFITSRLPQLSKGRQVQIENDLYGKIVFLLIGYQVDSMAYELTEKKYKQAKDKSLARMDSSTGTNQPKFSRQFFEKSKRPTKKLHRNGIRNLLQIKQSQKSLENFRLQVHQALHVRKRTERNSESRSQIKKKVTEDVVRSLGDTGWAKGKSKQLCINQVSAAFSIYMGSDANNRTLGKIHLSKRKRVKQYYFGLHKDEIQPQKSALPLCERSLNATKSKDWSLIVQTLKQRSQHIAEARQTDSFIKKQMLFHKKQPSIGAGSKFNHLNIDYNDDRQEENSVDFKKISNIDDDTINCINNELFIKKTIKKQPIKSGSTFFVRDRGQFERSCAQRKKIYQSSSIYLPKLDKY